MHLERINEEMTRFQSADIDISSDSDTPLVAKSIPRRRQTQNQTLDAQNSLQTDSPAQEHTVTSIGDQHDNRHDGQEQTEYGSQRGPQHGSQHDIDQHNGNELDDMNTHRHGLPHGRDTLDEPLKLVHGAKIETVQEIIDSWELRLREFSEEPFDVRTLYARALEQSQMQYAFQPSKHGASKRHGLWNDDEESTEEMVLLHSAKNAIDLEKQREEAESANDISTVRDLRRKYRWCKAEQMHLRQELGLVTRRFRRIFKDKSIALDQLIAIELSSDSFRNNTGSINNDTINGATNGAVSDGASDDANVDDELVCLNGGKTALADIAALIETRIPAKGLITTETAPASVTGSQSKTALDTPFTSDVE